MTRSLLVKRHVIAALIGFAAGALLWVLAKHLYARAQADEGISVYGCEEYLGMDPKGCG